MEIIGNVVRDARLRELQSGAKVINFTIAINYGYRNKQKEWKKETVYYDCSYWNSEAVAPFLTTGKLVQIQGRITGTNAWINKEGKPQGNITFRAASIQLHGTKGSGKPAGVSVAVKPGNETADTLPF